MSSKDEFVANPSFNVFVSNLSRDEKLVSQAIELNEQLQKILSKHDALLSVRATTTPAAFVDEEAEEEEEADRLFRRFVCCDHVVTPESFPARGCTVMKRTADVKLH